MELGERKDCFNIGETRGKFLCRCTEPVGRGGMPKLERRGASAVPGREAASVRAVGSGGGARGAPASADEIVKRV